MKKMLLVIAGLAFAASVAVAVRPVAAGHNDDHRNLVFDLKGTAVGEMRMIPPIAGTGTTTALCFDVDLIDPMTGHVVGKGTDCLSDVVPYGDGLAVTATTYFHLPGGTIITRGRTTVQPVLDGSPSMTHISGAIPSSNNILMGTGRFAGITGRSRLSGALNLSELATNNEITFDCLFVIQPD